MNNAKRLIDATALKDAMYSIKPVPDSEYIFIDVIIDEINKAPTVDVTEVVHGRWVMPYINRYGHPCHCCSECGFKASYQDRNYCPNCGAIDDEVGAYDGTSFYVTRDGVLKEPDCGYDGCKYFEAAKRETMEIKAVWRDTGNPCWIFETDIPHETFRIYEDEELFCVGIVFSVYNFLPF